MQRQSKAAHNSYPDLLGLKDLPGPTGPQGSQDQALSAPWTSKTQALRFSSPISITSALRRSSCWPPASSAEIVEQVLAAAATTRPHLPAVVARDRTPRWTTLMWRKTMSPGPLPRIGSSQLAGLVLYPEPTEEVRHVPIGCRSSVATNIGPVELADVAIPSRTSRQSN